MFGSLLLLMYYSTPISEYRMELLLSRLRLTESVCPALVRAASNARATRDLLKIHYPLKYRIP